MRKKTILFIMTILSCINFLYSEILLELNLEKIFELGQETLFFKSLTSIFDDEFEKVYVLDQKAYKVFMFSREGELQLSFGNRGQGPGDFLNPHSLFVTSEGNIFVNEISDFVSVFDKQGKFLSRINVTKGLDLNILNNHLFYAWIWTKKGRQQVLVDNKGKIIQSFFSVDKDDSSISLPDETGRLVMFNFFSTEYTPFLLFNRNKNYGIIGVTNKYEILLINQEGSIIRKFSRDIKPGIISPGEKEYFKEQINESQHLPDNIKKGFIRKIPRYKNYFSQILLTGSYAWIFRLKENVLEENSPLKVDLFAIDGTFKGTLVVKDLPLFLSDKYVYFEETNTKEDILLVKYKYDISIKVNRGKTGK